MCQKFLRAGSKNWPNVKRPRPSTTTIPPAKKACSRTVRRTPGRDPSVTPERREGFSRPKSTKSIGAKVGWFVRKCSPASVPPRYRPKA